MTLWELYLITTLPKLAEALSLLAVMALVAFLISFGLILLFGLSGIEDLSEREKRNLRGFGVAAFFATLFLGIGAIAVPNEKQLAIMVGGYAVTNIDGVEKLPENLVGAANAYLESVKEKEK